MEKYKLNTIMNLIKAHHKETFYHMIQVAELNKHFGEFLELKNEDICKLYIAGLLHDIGKFYIPDEVLSKKGPLTDSEFSRVKAHPALGLEILKKTDLGKYSKYRKEIMNVIYTHHVGVGKNYPKTDLKKSFYSNITSITDCYSALVSKREYKEAWSIDKTLNTMIESNGYNKELLFKFVMMIELMYPREQKISV